MVQEGPAEEGEAAVAAEAEGEEEEEVQGQALLMQTKMRRLLWHAAGKT